MKTVLKICIIFVLSFYNLLGQAFDDSDGYFSIVAPPGFSVIVMNDTAICAGTSLRLSAVTYGGNPNFTYSWTPAATLTNANTLNPTATPVATTIYILKVTDALGITATDSVIVTVIPLPNPVINGLTEASTGSTKTYKAVQSVNMKYLWGVTGGNVPGNIKSLDSVVVVWPGTPGTGTVTLTETTNQGNCSNSANIIVTITNIPTMTINAGNDVTINCAGDSVQIGLANPIVSGGTAPFTYKWTPAAGLSNDAIPNPFAKPVQTTVYKLTVTDYLQIKASDSLTVTVSANPTATIKATDLFENPKFVKQYQSKISLIISDGTLIGTNCKPDRIRAVIRLNKNLFYPNDSISSKWDNSFVTMTKEAPVPTLVLNAQIINFEGTVLLGDTTYTPIFIDSLIFIGAQMQTTLQNGSLTLTGVHEVNGEKRLLQFNWGAKFLQVAPNPTNGQLNLIIESSNPQNSILELQNLLGEKLTFYELNLNKNIEDIKLSLPDNLNSGQYLLILKSTNNVDLKQIFIIK